MIDFLDPLAMWQEEYPAGFSGKRKANLPILGSKLMIGADTSIRGVRCLPANIEASFSNNRLDVSVLSDDEKRYDGIVVAVYKLDLPDFDTVHLSVAESAAIELGRSGVFDVLPQGDRETPFGTINEMIGFALGHSALECFRA